MVPTLLTGQIIIACIVGILAGALFYAAGAWLLRRSRQSVTNTVEVANLPSEAASSPAAVVHSKAANEAVARLIEELSRPDKPRRRPNR